MVIHINAELYPVAEVIETPRLLLRAVRDEDVNMILESALRSHEQLRQWMPWATARPTAESVAEFVRASQEGRRRGELFDFVILRRSDGSHAGNLGVHDVHWDVPCFEIGYWLHTDFQGQGYGKEAVEAITASLFENQHAERIQIRCDARNERSAALALRAGFVLEARHHHDSRDNDGELNDTLVFVRFPRPSAV